MAFKSLEDKEHAEVFTFKYFKMNLLCNMEMPSKIIKNREVVRMNML